MNFLLPLLIFCATAALGDGASLTISGERRVPARYEPPSLTRGSDGKVLFIPPTPVFETIQVNSTMGVGGLQVEHMPAAVPAPATPEAITRWISSLKSFKSAEQHAATVNLKAAGDLAVEPLVTALQTADTRQQKLLVGILAGIPTAKAHVAIADIAALSSRAVAQNEALAALRQRISSTVRERLVTLASSQEQKTRTAAVRTIRAIGDRICIEFLIAALADARTPADTKAAVAASLQALTGEPIGTDAARWQAWWQPRARTFKYAAVTR